MGQKLYHQIKSMQVRLVWICASQEVDIMAKASILQIMQSTHMIFAGMRMVFPVYFCALFWWATLA